VGRGDSRPANSRIWLEVESEFVRARQRLDGIEQYGVVLSSPDRVSAFMFKHRELNLVNLM